MALHKSKIKPGMITIFMLLVTIFVWLQYKLWLENASIKQLVQLKNDIKTQQQENANLQLRNQNLHEQVQHLKKHSQAVVEEARKQLGMIKPDETFYRIVDADAAN